MQGFFDWDTFEAKLNCLSRWFSIRVRCDRFIAVCIHKNPNIQDSVSFYLFVFVFSIVWNHFPLPHVRFESIQDRKLKASFESLFKVTSPTLVTTRWAYMFLPYTRG